VQSVAELLVPLLRSRSFLIVCFLSLGCTIIRETFNAWTPVYLHDYLGYTASKAAGMSAIFPGVGAVSVLASGWLSDRLGANGRSVIMLVGLAATAAALLFLTSMPASAAGTLLPPLAIGIIAFCLLGPYSYLGGAFALDFGGKQASAVSSGIIDGIGYLGAVVAGDSVARGSVAVGWQGVFIALAGVSAIAALGAGRLYLLSARAAASGRHLPWARRPRPGASAAQPIRSSSNGRTARSASSRVTGCATICPQIATRTAASDSLTLRICPSSRGQPPEFDTHRWLQGGALDASRRFAWASFGAARSDQSLR